MPARTIVGVVDSDSYVKWGAHLLDELPRWRKSLVVVETPATASADQVKDALAGSSFATDEVPRLLPAQLLRRIASSTPDAVLLATRATVAEVLVNDLARGTRRRPVVVTGLPGISYPPRRRGTELRAQADLLVLHSHREVRAYREAGLGIRLGLASLPFAKRRRPSDAPRDSIVFAAQPTVPPQHAQRARIIGWLAEAARRRPEVRVVVKVRAVAGEAQTHPERHPYGRLLPPDAPANLVVEGGPMAAQLERAIGFVTVSSTAVIEAVAAGVPAIVLSDFGVSDELINAVFEGSGLLAPASELIGDRFRTVNDEWRRDNYFHPRSDDDWAQQLAELCEERDAGTLPHRRMARRMRSWGLWSAWNRKRVLGRFDRTPLGYVALVLGSPIALGRMVVARLLGRRPQP